MLQKAHLCWLKKAALTYSNSLLFHQAFEGSKVLVPFAGSGNTLIAAALNKMMPIGYDLTEEYRNSYVLKCEKYFGGGQDAC
jgi:hypothetical protein